MHTKLDIRVFNLYMIYTHQSICMQLVDLMHYIYIYIKLRVLE